MANYYDEYATDFSDLENYELIKSNMIKSAVSWISSSLVIGYAIKKTGSLLPILGYLLVPRYYITRSSDLEGGINYEQDKSDDTDNSGAESDVRDPGWDENDPEREDSYSDSQESIDG